MWIFQEVLHNCLSNNLLEALDSFVLNQFIAVSYSFCKFKSLLPIYIELSPANFASSAFLMKNSKSFIKRLKVIGPRIDP